MTSVAINCRYPLRSIAAVLLPVVLLVLDRTSAYCSPEGNIGRCSSVTDYSILRMARSSSAISLPFQRHNDRQQTWLQSTKWSDGIREAPPTPPCSISTDNNNNNNNNNNNETPVHVRGDDKPNEVDTPSALQRMIDEIPLGYLFRGAEARRKLPPLQVDDANVLLYDVFLIVNLSLSISFWVTHRVDFAFLPSAFNEGCLFSLLWIGAGLYHGSFLYSAVDGHYPPNDESGRGGPVAAAALAFNTYINAINLRLIAALLGALVQHRQVGMGPMEELIPLEIGCGLVLMTFWRALHSSYTPRM